MARWIWGYSDIESEFGMAKAEYDLTGSWTTYAAFGSLRGSVNTGPVSHKVNVGYSAQIKEDKTCV